MQTNRNFNILAEIFLYLSIITLLIATVTSILQLNLNMMVGRSFPLLIFIISCNCILIIASILTLLRKKCGLILLLIIYPIRFLISLLIEPGFMGTVLGNNLAFLIRDFGLVALGMCFKKNGISGWKSMLSSQHDKSFDVNKKTNTTTEVNESIKSSPEKRMLPIKTLKLKFKKTNIKPSKEQGNKRHRKYSKKSIFRVLILLLSIICLLTIAIIFFYVNSKVYPKNFESFRDKFKYCYSITNNQLASIYIDKYKTAKENNLENLQIEFLNTARLAKTDDIESMNYMAREYFEQALSSSDSLTLFSYVIDISNDVLTIDSDNDEAIENLVYSYFYSSREKEAYEIVEQLLFDNPNNLFGIYLMCEKYYKTLDWTMLGKWSRKVLNIKPEQGTIQETYAGDILFLYARYLYELGKEEEAKEWYNKAEKLSPYGGYAGDLFKIGGLPCEIYSLQIQNQKYDKTIIDKPGKPISSNRTQYLSPVIHFKQLRGGGTTFRVKLYENGELCTSAKSPDGFTFEETIFVREGLEVTANLMGWGSDKYGTWPSGKYRFEIWVYDKMLISKSFQIL